MSALSTSIARLLPGLSYEEYCALSAVNSTMLRKIDGLTLEHAAVYMRGEVKDDSEALDFGHSFHELLLRGKEDFAVHPETYAAPKDHDKVKKGLIAVGDPLPWNWSAGICKEWRKPHEGKIIHSQEEADAIRAMVRAVAANEEIAPYLAGQMEIAAECELRGRKFKALIDLLPTNPAAPVIDFKKCRSASPRAFVGDAIKRGYHLQASLYLDVLAECEPRRHAFWFVAVEDAPPHAIGITKWTDQPCSLLRVGRRRYRNAVLALEKAEQDGHWPGWKSVEAEEFAPTWMKEELENT